MKITVPSVLVLVRHAKSDGNVAEEEGLALYPNDPNAAWKHARSLLENRCPERVDSSDWSVAPEGELEAVILGTRLLERFPDGFDAYYTSEMERTIGTFSIALPHVESPERSPLLDEFWGHTEDDFQRVRDFFEQLCLRHAGERVLAIGHGNWIRSVVDVPPACVMITPKQLTEFRDGPLANTSLTIFVRNESLDLLELVEYNSMD